MYRTLWLALVLCLMTAGSATARTVTDPEMTFSVDLPDGWTSVSENAAPDQGHPIYTLRLSAPNPGVGGRFTPNIGIQILHNDTKLTLATRNQFKQGLQQLAPGLIFATDEMVELGGVPAWKLTYSGHIQQENVMGYSMLASARGRTYSVTFMSTGELYKEYEPQATAILKSFKLLKATPAAR